MLKQKERRIVGIRNELAARLHAEDRIGLLWSFSVVEKRHDANETINHQVYAYRQTALVSLVARQSHSTKNPMIWRECQLTEYRTVHYIQDSKEKETKASQDYAFAV